MSDIFKIVFQNSAQVLGALRQIAQLQNPLSRSTATYAGRVATTAQGLAPVLTGRLRSSISFTVENATAYVRASAYYAKFVEFGTRKMRAQPFMSPASRLTVAQFEQDVRNNLLQHIAEATAGI